MRLWSLHPKYLDSQGLIALWRESLLAKKVLEGKTKGYKNHPQLDRFKHTSQPLYYISNYLSEIYSEAVKRGYKFDMTKIGCVTGFQKIKITCGQLAYEKNHLLNKLTKRNSLEFYERLKDEAPALHPIFELTEGEIEIWEKV
jgi:hypothetical protein